jgi:hypothetical protein
MQEKNTFYNMFSPLTPSLRYIYQWLSFTGFGRSPLLDIEDKYTEPVVAHVSVPVHPVPNEIDRV